LVGQRHHHDQAAAMGDLPLATLGVAELPTL